MLDDEKFLETLIGAGRAGPDDEQVERLERRLEATFLSVQPRGSSGARRLHGAKWILAVVGIGVLSSVTDMRDAATGQAEPQSVATQAAPVAMAVAAPAEPPPSIAEPETVQATEPVGAELDSTRAEDAPLRVVGARAPDSPVVPAPSIPARTPTKAPLPTTPPAAPSEGTSEEPSETVAAAPSTPTPKADDAIVSPSPEDPPSSARAPSGESEVVYLRRAQAALTSNPTRALALADDHPTRFPDGVLAQEREVIAIDALLKLRRTADARARAAAFRVRYPSSAHLARVLSAVGDVP